MQLQPALLTALVEDMEEDGSLVMATGGRWRPFPDAAPDAAGLLLLLLPPGFVLGSPGAKIFHADKGFVSSVVRRLAHICMVLK